MIRAWLRGEGPLPGPVRAAVIAVVGAAAILVLLVRPGAGRGGAAPVVPAARPTLVSLGAQSCVPCRMMRDVVRELRDEPAFATLEVDVFARPDEAARYGYRMIPTQIFLGPGGAELSRHEGFLPADAIRARFAGHGFAAPDAAATREVR